MIRFFLKWYKYDRTHLGFSHVTQPPNRGKQLTCLVLNKIVSEDCLFDTTGASPWLAQHISILVVSRATATGMSSDIRRNSELLTQALLLDGVLSIFDRLRGLHLAQLCFVQICVGKWVLWYVLPYLLFSN